MSRGAGGWRRRHCSDGVEPIKMKDEALSERFDRIPCLIVDNPICPRRPASVSRVHVPPHTRACHVFFKGRAPSASHSRIDAPPAPTVRRRAVQFSGIMHTARGGVGRGRGGAGRAYFRVAERSPLAEVKSTGRLVALSKFHRVPLPRGPSDPGANAEVHATLEESNGPIRRRHGNFAAHETY